MSKIEALEKQVAALSPEELHAFRAWFAVFDDEHWDRQLERDAENGKLDALAQSAKSAFDGGRTTPL